MEAREGKREGGKDRDRQVDEEKGNCNGGEKVKTAIMEYSEMERVVGGGEGQLEEKRGCKKEGHVRSKKEGRLLEDGGRQKIP
ncbi:hypothetical protein E2C01_036678 [Portunus trituberculatus]|uniref:Uncharacterized protein n=1 Tax=Portunus trituberculatus TaxID=210409 RepID=A0A5B7F9B5_PORTR|nr:hypothetical protein [Portunus trituberculatus]